MKANNTTILLNAAAYVRNETIINGNQAAQLDSLTNVISELTAIIDRNAVKIAERIANGLNVEMLERMTARYKAKLSDAVASLRAWLVDFKANRPNVQINIDEPTTTETTNTPSTMNANEINTPEFSELSHAATSAICPLDFPTAIDAYNYALAHQHDTTPLAVAIESDNHNAPLLRSLVLNGVKVFGVWCDAMDDTATSLLYTTEAGAREAMAQIEANDREAGIYEPDYYTVVDMSKYFA